MGCGASREIGSDGQPKCFATVQRRLLVLRCRQKRGSRTQEYRYELDHDIEFVAGNLDGYKIVRPLECNLELAGAVSDQLKKKYRDWSFVCQVRDGSRRLLPSGETDQPQPEIVLIQKTSFCRCRRPDNHDITLTVEEDRAVEEPVVRHAPALEIREGPPQYQKTV